MFRKVAALGAAVAVGAAGYAGFENVTPADPPGPSHTIYSFVRALKQHNYGRACSYYSQAQVAKMEGYRGCREGFLASAAQALLFFGEANPYGTAFVVPGSAYTADDNTVTYELGFRGQPERYTATVVRTEAGNWRIDSIA